MKPFGGGLEVSDIIQATLFGPIRPLAPRVEEPLPEGLEAIVLELLERDNFLRPANAAAVADALDRLAAERGLRWRLEEKAAAPAVEEFPEFTIEAQWVQTVGLAAERGKAVAG
jgi:hypothetical protein